MRLSCWEELPRPAYECQSVILLFGKSLACAGAALRVRRAFPIEGRKFLASVARLGGFGRSDATPEQHHGNVHNYYLMCKDKMYYAEQDREHSNMSILCLASPRPAT